MAHWSESFPAVPETARRVRCAITDIARECGMSRTGIAGVKLAVSEAVTNAIQHAHRDDRTTGTVTASATTGDGVLEIVIGDDGHGMTPRRDSPGLGLGLPLIAAVATSFEIVDLGNGAGTELHMTFAYPRAGLTQCPGWDSNPH
jgi:serine/threonine-protein kinase RsbW